MNERCPYCGEGTIAERLVGRVLTREHDHICWQAKAMLCDVCGFGGLTADQVAFNEQQERAAASAPVSVSVAGDSRGIQNNGEVARGDDASRVEGDARARGPESARSSHGAAEHAPSAGPVEPPPSPTQSRPVAGDAEALARRFHETYERLAPQYGYTTREETREWDPHSPNGRLMIATCKEVLQVANEQSSPAAGDSDADEGIAALNVAIAEIGALINEASENEDHCEYGLRAARSALFLLRGKRERNVAGKEPT